MCWLFVQGWGREFRGSGAVRAGPWAGERLRRAVRGRVGRELRYDVELVLAVAGKRGLPRRRGPGFMCNGAAEFFGRSQMEQGGESADGVMNVRENQSSDITVHASHMMVSVAAVVDTIWDELGRAVMILLVPSLGPRSSLSHAAHSAHGSYAPPHPPRNVCPCGLRGQP